MGSEWRDTTLGDVLTFQRGFDLPEADRKPGSYPVVASTGPVGYHKMAMVKGPGVVIGRSGSLGGGQFIESDFWPLNTTLWVKDFKGNAPRFCYYLLKSLDLAHFNAGSGVPTLNRNHIHPLPVKVPGNAAEQRAIAHILGTLDDKIELNRQQNETLEAMARALFKAWFVDFEPVRAKIEGRWQRGQSLPGLPANLYDLFPDRLVDSELGEIPEGWGIGRVSDFLSLAYGKSLPAGIRNPGLIPVYGSGGITGYHDTALVDSQTVIVGRKGTVGSLYWEQLPCFPIDTVFYVQPKVALPFCYHLLESIPLGDMNTDAAVPGLNRENVYRLDVISPHQALLDNFSVMARALRNQIFCLQNESRTLAQLRDTLLPKLISGELRIKNAEAFLKERG